MKKNMFIVLLVVLAISVLLVMTVFADHEPVGLTIDSFISPQLVRQGGPAPQTISQSAAAPGTAVGNERDVEVSITQGTSTIFGLSFISDVGTGGLSLDATSVLGLVNLVWDGPDGTSTIDFDGLSPDGGISGLDLTDGGRLTGYHIHVDSSDAPFIMRFRVYTFGSSGADWSEWVFNEPAPAVTEKSYFVQFNQPADLSSGAGADETNVGAISLQLDATQVASVNLDLNLDFVEVGSKDYGDLPAGYGVTTGGANHILNDLFLGTPPTGLIDGELDGFPSEDALGDDSNNSADEDGVTPIGTGVGSTWIDGPNGATVSVDVSDANANGGCLSAWIDWDGSSINPGDLALVIDRQAVVDGTNVLTFDVPAGTFDGAGLNRTFYSRFRLYPDTGIPGCADEPASTLTGEVFNGEVEDYRWGFTPTAVSLQSFSAGTGSSLPVYGLIGFAALAMVGVVALVLRRERKQA